MHAYEFDLLRAALTLIDVIPRTELRSQDASARNVDAYMYRTNWEETIVPCRRRVFISRPRSGFHQQYPSPPLSALLAKKSPARPQTAIVRTNSTMARLPPS